MPTSTNDNESNIMNVRCNLSKIGEGLFYRSNIKKNSSKTEMHKNISIALNVVKNCMK
jgi:hypothetical protein